MEIVIRQMLPEEARAVQKLGRKSFPYLEALYIPKPKNALVALHGGLPVAAFTYTIETAGGKKLGRVDFLYTHPDFSGSGVGRRLCEAGFAFLWGEGCDLLTTFVRDDNPASWRIFERGGFVRASFFSGLAGQIGVWGTLTQMVKSMQGFSPAHDLYLALPGGESEAARKKTGSAGQIAAYLSVHLLLGLLAAFRAGGDLLLVPAAIAAVFLGLVLAGYLGTLPSRRRWRFRMTNGGGIFSLLFGLIGRGSFFPMVGGWYPEVYEKTPAFRRDLAINAMAGWAFLLLALPLARHWGAAIPLLGTAYPILAFLAVFRCFPLRVVDSFGFGRVFSWNKIAAGLFVAATLALVYLF